MRRRLDSSTVDKIRRYLHPEHWVSGSDTAFDPFYLLAEENKELCKNELGTLFSQLLVIGLIPSDKSVSFDQLYHILERKFESHDGAITRLTQTLVRIRRALSENRKNLRQELRDEELSLLYDNCEGHCKICRLEFSNQAREAFFMKSQFKPTLRWPYYDRMKQFRSDGLDVRIEIDHIQSVSFLGSNELENLQLLCAHCNKIKREHFTVFDRIKPTLKSTTRLDDFVVLRLLSRGRCQKCEQEGNTGKELSTYVIDLELPPVFGNLGVTCVDPSHDPITDKRWMTVESPRGGNTF